MDTGKILTTTRLADGSQEKVKEELVDPNTFKPEVVSANLKDSVSKVSKKTKTHTEIVNSAPSTSNV